MSKFKKKVNRNYLSLMKIQVFELIHTCRKKEKILKISKLQNKTLDSAVTKARVKIVIYIKSYICLIIIFIFFY